MTRFSMPLVLALALALFTGTALAGNGNGNGNGNGVSGTAPGNSANAPGQKKKDQAQAGTQAQGKGKSATAAGQQKQKKAKKAEKAGKSAQAPGHTKVKPSKPKAHANHSSNPTAKGKGHEKTAHHKVIICHHTGSATNPYVVINISINGWLNGHSKHRGDILLKDPAAPGEKLPDSACPHSQQRQAASIAQVTASTPPAAPAVAAGGVLGAFAATKAAPKPAAKQEAGGVLGAFSSLGKTAAKGTLPFTGLPLWIAALLGATLLAGGLALRRGSI